MCVFVILYVWQNIELMKIKMDFKRLSAIERELTMERDVYLIKREIQLRADNIKEKAPELGLRKISPGDIEIIEVVK